MRDRITSEFSTRKKPKQARSTELVAIILEAAIQVLMHEAPVRFTTARVAQRAGVSIGSIYQYFPNKAAILFKLQADEWQKTMELLDNILSDKTVLPLQRLRNLVHIFVQSECEEARVRMALNDIAPLYDHSHEAQKIRGIGEKAIGNFINELLPNTPDEQQKLVTKTILVTLGAVGKDFSTRPRMNDEISAYAEMIFDMFYAVVSKYLNREK